MQFCLLACSVQSLLSGVCRSVVAFVPPNARTQKAVLVKRAYSVE